MHSRNRLELVDISIDHALIQSLPVDIRQFPEQKAKSAPFGCHISDLGLQFLAYVPGPGNLIDLECQVEPRCRVPT